jgi:uncharacterized membrane protein
MTTLKVARAKQPRTIVAGPYGHPFHPVMVTVPIGAWVSSVILDIVSLTTDNTALAEASLWLIAIGIIAALLAAVLGLLDLSTIPRDTKAFRTGITHAGLNVIVVTLFAVDLWIRYGHGTESVPTTGFVISVVAVMVLGASGWLGGKLAYHYGVRVADEHTQAEGFHQPPPRQR